jgi:hypothetical protein
MAKATSPTFVEKRYPFVFFSFFYFLFTALTYRNYGETWDESGVYARGLVLGRYLVDGQWMGLLHKAAPDDGMVLYDHWYAFILSLLNPTMDIAYYHWLNLAFGFFLFAAAYEVLLAQTQKPWAAVLGPLFLFLTPRLIGDLPANPKDGPFAVLYFVGLAAVFLLNRKAFPILPKILILGFLFGLTVSQRLVGFTLFLVWPLYEWILWRWEAERPKSKPKNKPLPFWRAMIPAFLLVFILSNFILVATWPYLGADYFHRMIELLGASKNYPWTNNVLFMGREIPAPDLPRRYLPLWLLITTPLFILIWFLKSFGAIKKIRQNPLWLLLALALGLNLVFYLLLKPVVYDGLRHFLFLLPIISVMAAGTLAEFLTNGRPSIPQRVAWIVTALLALLVAVDGVRLHPYEYVYFNELTGSLRGAQGRFEADYWGASYKEAVEWVQTQEPADRKKPILLNANGNSYQLACYFDDRLGWTDDLTKADYYLSTTRDGKDKLVDASKIVHIVEREGVPLNYVFKLK